MGVQERIRVAEDLYVHATKRRIVMAAHVLDGRSEEIDIRQVADALAPRQAREPIDPWHLREREQAPGSHCTSPMTANERSSSANTVGLSPATADPTRSERQAARYT